MHQEYGGRFPRHWLQGKQPVSDPGVHHGTRVTHVPGCMYVGIANPRWRGNVPGIPGAYATRNFTYLVRGPLLAQQVVKMTLSNAISNENLDKIAISPFLWRPISRFVAWSCPAYLTLRRISHDSLRNTGFLSKFFSSFLGIDPGMIIYPTKMYDFSMLLVDVHPENMRTVMFWCATVPYARLMHGYGAL